MVGFLHNWWTGIFTGKWLGVGATNTTPEDVHMGWRILMVFITLMVIGYVFDFVMVVARGLFGVKSSFTSDPMGFLNKSVAKSNLSHRDNFSRDPLSAGASVSWPPTPELLEANASTVSSWGNQTVRLSELPLE